MTYVTAIEESPLTCVLVVYPNGEKIWEPLRDYLRNPPQNTYIERQSHRTTK